MHHTPASEPSNGFWLIAAGALVWNLIGVMTYLMQVSMTPESLSELPADERALYTNVPAWVTAAYATAVFAGTIGSIGLLLRRRWCLPAFVASLVAVLVQMVHALFMTELLSVRGGSAAVLPVVIIAVAILLVWYAYAIRRKSWLK